ncbi:MAG: hypothetical protein FWE70_02770 [Oscillospiraceae bacterium]|nr:hypothetical protein [Oscillospiraceae bacterium]
MRELLEMALARAKQALRPVKTVSVLAVFLLLTYTAYWYATYEGDDGGRLSVTLTDMDGTFLSGVLVGLLSESAFFDIRQCDEETASFLVSSGRCEVGFIIKPGFEEALRGGVDGFAPIRVIKSSSTVSHVAICELLSGSINRIKANAEAANMLVRLLGPQGIDLRDVPRPGGGGGDDPGSGSGAGYGAGEGGDKWLEVWAYGDSFWYPEPLMGLIYVELSEVGGYDGKTAIVADRAGQGPEGDGEAGVGGGEDDTWFRVYAAILFTMVMYLTFNLASAFGVDRKSGLNLRARSFRTMPSMDFACRAVSVVAISLAAVAANLAVTAAFFGELLIPSSLPGLTALVIMGAAALGAFASALSMLEGGKAMTQAFGVSVMLYNLLFSGMVLGDLLTGTAVGRVSFLYSVYNMGDGYALALAAVAALSLAFGAAASAVMRTIKRGWHIIGDASEARAPAHGRGR